MGEMGPDFGESARVDCENLGVDCVDDVEEA